MPTGLAAAMTPQNHPLDPLKTQFYFGLSVEAQVHYGMSPHALAQLKDAIKIAGSVSLRQLAKRAGISRTTLSKMVAGKPVRNASLLLHKILNAIRAAQQEKSGNGCSES